MGGIKASKQNQEAIDNQDENDKKQIEMMGDSEKAQFELAEKQIEMAQNPEEQIWNNSELSQTEKKHTIFIDVSDLDFVESIFGSGFSSAFLAYSVIA